MTNENDIKVAYVVFDDSLSFTIEDRTYFYTFDSSEKKQKICELLKNNEYSEVESILNIKESVNSFLSNEGTNNNFEIIGDIIYFNKIKMDRCLSKHVLRMIDDGFDVEPLLLFMDNLSHNPSKSVIDELYAFLDSAKAFSLTPDGCFLAYKKVRFDFKDIHSGTFDNSPGKVVQMERNRVCDDRNQTCSTGLHFCSKEYLGSFGHDPGDKIVLVKINPRDVVSIPVDYNNTKGRCCKYEVLRELSKDEVDEIFEKSSVYVQDEVWVDEQNISNIMPESEIKAFEGIVEIIDELSLKQLKTFYNNMGKYISAPPISCDFKSKAYGKEMCLKRFNKLKTL